MSGHKNDNGKARMDLISADALLEMGQVLALGAEMHGDYNWKKVSLARHYAAAQRHLNKFWSGKILDKSGYHHLIHAITDLMFVYELDDKRDISIPNLTQECLDVNLGATGGGLERECNN